MKKVIGLVLILLITLSVVGTTYAATTCRISLGAENTELSKNEEFVLDVNITNLQSDRGIITFGGTLEFDKESLELVNMEGVNGWKTPGINTEYNPVNGKIAIDRSGFATKNETMLKIKFRVKETSKANLTIILKDITVADGVEPIKVTTVDKGFTIKDGNSGITTPTNPGETEKPNDTEKPSTNPGQNGNGTNNGTTTNPGSNSDFELKITSNVKKDNKLPQTGEYDYIMLVGIAGLILLAGGFVMKIKLVNKMGK